MKNTLKVLWSALVHDRNGRVDPLTVCLLVVFTVLSFLLGFHDASLAVSIMPMVLTMRGLAYLEGSVRGRRETEAIYLEAIKRIRNKEMGIPDVIDLPQ